MKKYFLVALLFTGVAAMAQKPAPKKTVPVKTTTTNPLKTLNDSVSYAIGMSVANFYQQKGIKTLNTAIVSRAINDVFQKKAALLTETQGNDAVMHCLNPNL